LGVVDRHCICEGNGEGACRKPVPHGGGTGGWGVPKRRCTAREGHLGYDGRGDEGAMPYGWFGQAMELLKRKGMANCTP